MMPDDNLPCDKCKRNNMEHCLGERDRNKNYGDAIITWQIIWHHSEQTPTF